MEKIKVFFSWASEHQDSKEFILKVLDRLKQLMLSYDIDVEIQESTSNQVGFVKIEDVVLNRIELCDFFFADLTPTDNADKPIVNSNVCFELGYMIGQHGVDRVFGMCNQDKLKNPSTDLPFDFSHNRVFRISISGNEEMKIEKYANEIKEIILSFKEDGNLHSIQPLKEHDIKINDRIRVDMEHFKDLFYSDVYSFEMFYGTDKTNNEESERKFILDLARFMQDQANHFANDSLEVYRVKLYKAICNFHHVQAYKTYPFYVESLGGFIHCTKMHFIKIFPDLCREKGLPDSNDMSTDKYNEAIAQCEEERKEYLDAAAKVIQCYQDLETRYLHLVK
ncbi:putative nucleotide-binding protein with TIR-like domain [Ruminococcaceae bacterium R-25]|nr:putative nucleotide-binding protein with TIR-like domain [Ruminococcaceae bacterium R-25]SUQ11010.1 Predicted nucleotide-binding protein containing TIR-like domain-containing protein [Oscillospiraceae bacterium]